MKIDGSVALVTGANRGPGPSRHSCRAITSWSTRRSRNSGTARWRAPV